MAITTDNAGKQKALNMVLNQIEKTFGKGTIMRLGDATRMRVPRGTRDEGHSRKVGQSRGRGVPYASRRLHLPISHCAEGRLGPYDVIISRTARG